MARKNKFNIGDIIVATKDSNNPYSITKANNDFVGEVIELRTDYQDDIKVKVLETKTGYSVGRAYDVDSQYFELKAPRTAEEQVEYISKAFKQEKETLLKAVKEFETNTSILEEKLANVDFTTLSESNKARKEAIEKAIKFVDGNKRIRYVKNQFTVNVEYIVNEEKRTVVAIGRGFESGIVRAKGVAKCDPKDTFNIHIGKAIALGRLMDADVTEFIKVPNPDDIVVGQIVTLKKRQRNKYVVKGIKGVAHEGKFNLEAIADGSSGWEFADNLAILNDTDAKY